VAALLVAFAANLLGAFEVAALGSSLGSLGASAAGARRSFFDGLLAVLLATPCSAPFLGTAIGFAFASSAPVIAAIFAAIGLGLAAPFVAVAAVPAWSRWLPRPGGWMLELRRGLGFALLATVVWLVWIVGRAAGPDAMAGLLMVLVAIGFAAFLFGLVQRTRGHAPGVLLFGAVAALLVAGLDLVELSADPASRPVAAEGAPLAYSRPALDEALAAGRPVLVYYTADWCLTCKLNERRVLAHPQVREALAARGFTVLRADWTRRDETIRQELARLGKAGVPVYALYGAGGPGAPRLLPELLRLEPFLNALAETADETERAAAPGDRSRR
jgi:thiol:disulfide interchange protein DsbD